jgi:hypothetical protein
MAQESVDWSCRRNENEYYQSSRHFLTPDVCLFVSLSLSSPSPSHTQITPLRGGSTKNFADFFFLLPHAPISKSYFDFLRRSPYLLAEVNAQNSRVSFEFNERLLKAKTIQKLFHVSSFNYL